MKVLSNQSHENLGKIARGKYEIALYDVSGGRADAVYGDVLGKCEACEDREALQVARHLKAVNPIFVKLKGGSAYLIADEFPMIQSQIMEEINKLGEPNGFAGDYSYYSVCIFSPIFWGGKPIAVYKNKKMDLRGNPDGHYGFVEYVSP